MSGNIKRIILIIGIIIGVLILINTLTPTKQKISIPLYPQYKLFYINSSVIQSDNLFINKSNNILKTYSFRLYNLDDVIERLSIPILIEEIYYKESEFYLTSIVQSLSDEVDEKERMFFKNAYFRKSIIINPEDGKARQSTGTVEYIGKNSFNEAEIYELTKKIETRLSQLFFENYLKGLNNFLNLLNEIIIPENLLEFDQRIELLENKLDDLSVANPVQIANSEILENALSVKEDTIMMLLDVNNKPDSSQVEGKYYQIESLLSEIKSNREKLEQLASSDLRLVAEKSNLLLAQNEKKNMIKKTNLIKNDLMTKIGKNSMKINSIDTANITSTLVKGNMKIEIYYTLLAIFAILSLLTYLIFFRKGLKHFIKKYMI